VDVTIKRSGVFEFYVEYQDISNKTSRTRTASSYFTVDPIITVTSRRRILSDNPISLSPSLTLPIDGIVLQSVLPKLLGTFGEWEPHLRSIAEVGYNMIHFLPMQTRGMSDSPYSIYDQLQFSTDLFDESNRGKSDNDKNEIVKEMIKNIETQHGILSLTDIVWNHTACNCKWLEEHPEAGMSSATRKICEFHFAS
jgi:glycogen debranching enzyme